MKYSKLLFIIIVAASCQAGLDSSNQSSSKVSELLRNMTWNEKIGQLSMSYVPELNSDVIAEIKSGKIGAILNGRTSFYSRVMRDSMQRIAVESSRLGIPILFGHDVIHGFRTIFPISLGQSCSWDIDLIRNAAEVAASEASSYGVNWAFSPMVDVSRDPRWGRIAESYGEDPYLNSVFGAAVVSGYQGEQLDSLSFLAACMKHYVGYGAAEGGRDYDYTEISERTLSEVYLPPFKAGLDAGAQSIMSAFNDISGIPATSNTHTVRDKLKNEWNFGGVVLSDWDAIAQLRHHGVAVSDKDAAVAAIKAGVDMEMKTKTYFELDSLNLNHKTWVDESVERLLMFKEKIGLFDQPYAATKYQLTPDTLSRFLARKIARESMVMLKNDRKTLPLQGCESIAVVGPFSEEKELMGWWKSLGDTRDVITPYQGLDRLALSKINVTKKITNFTDLIVACVGESQDWFGENNNRAFLDLPGEQEEWVKSLKKYGKPIVLIIFNGRPLSLTNIIDDVNSILIAWHPGIEAGNALADLLYGFHSPSGKLTTTWPRSVGQVPLYYNRRTSGRPDQISYKDELITPLFPFGFGLSYSSFEYDVPEGEFVESHPRITIDVTNQGQTKASEIVQLYRKRADNIETFPRLSLIGFDKKLIAPDEIKTFIFQVADHQPRDRYFCGSSSADLVEVGI
ncbi:MAG: glycoside hydrolase family 3 C-terminal domain-containing protein [Cyclobacteriaceae bacterium]|nr:glycoside hydrolase family 3 C-terminal domain-containing protein [Cyclobacteriaceae bacterium HetDA_MAG_MS6]